MPLLEPSRLLRWWMFAVLLACPLLLAGEPPTVPRYLSASERVIERRLEAAEVQSYQAELDPRHRYLVQLEQRGIDIILEAELADNAPLVVNAPTYRHGWESILFPPRAAGSWRITVKSASAAVGPGAYRIQLVEVTDAGAERLLALAAVSEAGQLNFLATVEDRRRATEQLEQALCSWRALADRQGEARALFGLGASRAALDQPRLAITAYRAALPLLRQLGERQAEAVALSDLGLAHWRLGESTEAQTALEAALALQQALGNRYGAAIALNNLCLRSHSEGRLRDALECYQEVLQLLREQGEFRHEALVLSNLGSAYNNLGEPQLALEHHERALALRQATGDRKGEAQSLNNIAVVYRRGGEMQAALDHYLGALAVRRELGDTGRQGSALHNIGFAYFSLGEPRRALTFLGQALALRRQVGDRRGESITLSVLGQVRSSLAEHRHAQQLFSQSLALRRAVGDRRGEASTLNRMGQSLVAAGDPRAALGLFDQVLAVLASIEDRREAATALHSRGAAQLALGEPRQAQFSLRRALSLRLGMSDPYGEIESLTVLAEAQRQLGQLHSARRDVEQALARVESLRTRVSAADLRATFLASQRQAYELEIDLLMELHSPQPGGEFAQLARQVAEQARARSLLDMLSAAGTNLGRPLDPDLRRRRQLLQRRLDAKASRRLTLLSQGRAEEEAQLELYEVVADLDSLEAEIRRQSPRYEALAYPRPLDLAATQDLLTDDTLLLEYTLGTRRSFLWVLTASSFEVHELPGSAELEQVVRPVVQQLATFDPRASGEQRQAARKLSDLLLGPVAERLLGHRLVVVADGVLHYLPFATLPAPARRGATESAGRPMPLVLEHEVVHLPSASALSIQRAATASRLPAPRWAAVLADPVFDARDPRLGAARVRSGSPAGAAGLRQLSFDRLPSSRREATAIASLGAPAEVMMALDFAANRQLVLGGELRHYRIVHFATHGLIHAETPQLSGLVLSLFDQQGKAREGFLRLRDIYDLQLAADLVVLSGCQTALGREILGEGLVGLTRGFMYAGVPRVVASLWRVEDRATAELMAHFYRSMSVDGLTPAAALRAAQISILSQRRWADPYYWGAFVLQGEWQ